MIAVITTGGKQYIVKSGDVLKVEKITGEVGTPHDFDSVLLLSDDTMQDVKIGTPNVENAKVQAEIVAHGKAKKVTVVKYKPKIRYRRTVGHRQLFTQVKVLSIQ